MEWTKIAKQGYMMGVGIINAETEKNKRSKRYLKVLHNIKERS